MNAHALQRLLDDWLHAARYEGMDDPHGVFLSSPRDDVHRVGLLLEPWPGLIGWIADQSLDGLFIHRPWKLTDEQRHDLTRRDVGVLSYHLAFDETLTTGLNPTLAAARGWGEPTVLGHKEGRPLGMVCALPAPCAFAAEADRLHEEFSGLEDTVPPSAGPNALIERVAVMGAMNESLVRAAHAAGAGLYVTGQWRPAAKRAVHKTGIGVVALGHQRSEVWGLHALARRLNAQATDLRAIVGPD